MLACEPRLCWRENEVAVVSFSQSVVVAGTSYQMLEVLAFCNLDRAQPPLITTTVLTFLVKKKHNEEFRGVYFFVNTRKNLKIKSHTRSRSRPRI